MSEPTYRVELEHRPNETRFPWSAGVFRISDDTLVGNSIVAETQEQAFDGAQEMVRYLSKKQPSRTVMLSEDGDILDPHEVQR